MKLLIIPAMLFAGQALANTEIFEAQPAELVSQGTVIVNGHSYIKLAAQNLEIVDAEGDQGIAQAADTLYAGDQIAEPDSQETYTLTGEVVAQLEAVIDAKKLAADLGLELTYVRGNRAIFVHSTEQNLLEVLNSVSSQNGVVSAELGMSPDNIEAE